jgi:hypothetical protein
MPAPIMITLSGRYSSTDLSCTAHLRFCVTTAMVNIGQSQYGVVVNKRYISECSFSSPYICWLTNRVSIFGHVRSFVPSSASARRNKKKFHDETLSQTIPILSTPSSPASVPGNKALWLLSWSIHRPDSFMGYLWGGGHQSVVVGNPPIADQPTPAFSNAGYWSGKNFLYWANIPWTPGGVDLSRVLFGFSGLFFFQSRCRSTELSNFSIETGKWQTVRNYRQRLW